MVLREEGQGGTLERKGRREGGKRKGIFREAEEGRVAAVVAGGS